MRLKTSVWVSACMLLACLHDLADAKQYLRIRERPTVRFSWECTNPRYFSAAKLSRAVRRLMIGSSDEPGRWGERAFPYDLNGDKVPEYFVPLECGATGNCRWAVFALHPTRTMGIIWAENFYAHRRVRGWARITTSEHMNVSESMLETYHFLGGRYRRFGTPYPASAYRNNFPTSLLTVEPLCDPGYIPGSIHPQGVPLPLPN